MTTRPLVSIITVYKDDEKALVNTLQSLSSQSSDNIDWIIVDGSQKRLNKHFFAGLKFPIHYIYESDDGIYQAMNKGITRANGYYLNFLNAGDILASSDCLSVVESLLCNYTPDLLFMGSVSCFAKWKYLRLPSKTKKYLKVSMPSSHQSTFYRLDFIRRNILYYDPSFNICGDYELYQRSQSFFPSIAYSDFVYVVFDTSGISSRRPIVLWKESSRISFKYLPAILALYASIRCILSLVAFQFYRLYR